VFRNASGLAVFGTTLGLLAAGRGFLSYPSARPILEEQRDRLPAELRDADEARWRSWTQQRDKAIRARLEQGDLDSMVNLLLYGTSFTRQPKILMEGITEASKRGILGARVDDLVAGIRNPSGNERLIFCRGCCIAKALISTQSRQECSCMTLSCASCVRERH